MMICKNVLKEIAVHGTDISAVAKAHTAECNTCAAALKEESELEHCLLSAVEVETPARLKSAILDTVVQKKPGWSFFPVLGTAIKTAAAVVILLSGFWLGLQMANGQNGIMPNSEDDIDLSRATAYKLNTTAVEPGDLGRVYLNVVWENDENRENGNVQ